jgi:hypothetical protein
MRRDIVECTVTYRDGSTETLKGNGSILKVTTIQKVEEYNFDTGKVDITPGEVTYYTIGMPVQKEN